MPRLAGKVAFITGAGNGRCGGSAWPAAGASAHSAVAFHRSDPHHGRCDEGVDQSRSRIDVHRMA